MLRFALLVCAIAGCSDPRSMIVDPPVDSGVVVMRDAGIVPDDIIRCDGEIPDPRCFVEEVDAGMMIDAGYDAGPPDHPPDDGTPPPPIPEECYADPNPGPVPSGPGICTVSLYGGTIAASTSACYIDEDVANNRATLTYPCSGGEAHAIFGAHHFTGWVHADGYVDLCLGTTFTFSDGCEWISAQQIYGSVSATSLSFAYTEVPAAGYSGCAAACTGSGTVYVE